MDRAPGVRRSQSERSAATRGRLLEATIDCLVEHGYAGTTVARVAERAEVTRGAQVHHFPSKEALVLSAVRHLNELRLQDAITRLEGLPTGPDWVDALLDVMWEQHQGTVFVATTEMWVAARTHPELSEHVDEVEALVNAEMTGPSPWQDPEVRDAIYTSMDAIRGQVMSSWHLPQAEVDARWQRLKRHLRQLFP